ncbi:hypothetical protein GCM10023219_24000 [Stakelama sediminis]
MGWVALGLIGIGAFALMMAFGLRRNIWMLGGAALMLGATGYALQGSPDLPDAPVSAERPISNDGQGLRELREMLFGRITGESPYFLASEALIRSGSTETAVTVMLGGVSSLPDNAALWTGLGTAYSAHDHGLVSPAGKLAFNRAMALAPKHPGPPFFYGLALVREGDYAAALPLWRHALALTPKTAPYYSRIAMRLALLQRMIALMDQQARTTAQ